MSNMYRVDPAHIPKAVLPYVPLTERWSFDDQDTRYVSVRYATNAELEELANLAGNPDYNNTVGRWLVDEVYVDEANFQEYFAFSVLGFVADAASGELMMRTSDGINITQHYQPVVDEQMVPEALKSFVPLLQKWALIHPYDRMKAIEHANDIELTEVAAIIDTPNFIEVGRWINPQFYSGEPETDELLAYDALYHASLEAAAELKKRAGN